MNASLRPSACPGLLRIVPALDGGICRVKLPGGVLRGAQARAIAEAARRHASGVLELTNRSNLQIRGVLPGQEAPLIDALLGAGLGPRVAAADDVRNLLLSPAAGLDPQARMDVRPLASQLLDLLQDTPALHALSPKFALQLDGGEALAMREHPHDLWLAAEDDQHLLLAWPAAPLRRRWRGSKRRTPSSWCASSCCCSSNWPRPSRHACASCWRISRRPSCCSAYKRV